MGIVQRLDEIGKPAWISLMVLSFIFAWPVGLALLAFMIGSGRMGCRHGRWGRWAWAERDGGAFFAEKAAGWWHQGRQGGARAGSGNRAFDEYRTETLRRLEDEQREFKEFLDRLRYAKDKAEFDDFLAERRTRPAAPEEPPHS
jgi:hypothetical protein